jgi:hypothetical protein
LRVCGVRAITECAQFRSARNYGLRVFHVVVHIIESFFKMPKRVIADSPESVEMTKFLKKDIDDISPRNVISDAEIMVNEMFYKL